MITAPVPTSRFTLVVLLLLAAAVLHLRAELRVGTAAVKITPPVGTPMAGYYFVRAAAGVHDELYAKTIVLELDGQKTALVALDLIGTTRRSVEAARKMIAQDASWAGSNVMISATHAHTGPVLSDGSLRAESLGGQSGLAETYFQLLPSLMAESVRLAEARLTPARAYAAIGQEDTLAFNRRYHMKDGTVGWNPGKLNTNIVRAAGPIDPTVPVIFFEASTGSNQPLATYVNYAMHLDTVGGLDFSADYPFTLANLLAKVKGPEMLTLFTIGTAGDINHVNVNWPNNQKGHREAARIGTVLAGAVLKAFTDLAPVDATRLRTRSRMVKLALAEIGPDEAAKARQIITRRGGPKSEQPTFLETVHAFKVLDVNAREGQPHEVEVQVVALGDQLAWVSLPGEIFVELGLAIKKSSPFKHTVIAELANGSIGYIPSRRAWAQGNYEVVSARCAAGSGEQLVETALDLLRQLSQSDN